MSTPRLDAGAALGAAAFAVSAAALLAQHAPGVAQVAGARPGDSVADDLRVAELTAGLTVLGATGAASVLLRAWWPLLLGVTVVGSSIAIYEGVLRWENRSR